MQLLFGHSLRNYILSRVQRLQNRAARIITGNFDYINARGIAIVKRLQWMNVIERRDYFVALTVFKCIRGMAPTYMSDCIPICNEVAVRDTRNSTSANLVTLPYASMDIFKELIRVQRSTYMECPSSRY